MARRSKAGREWAGPKMRPKGWNTDSQINHIAKKFSDMTTEQKCNFLGKVGYAFSQEEIDFHGCDMEFVKEMTVPDVEELYKITSEFGGTSSKYAREMNL